MVATPRFLMVPAGLGSTQTSRALNGFSPLNHPSIRFKAWAEIQSKQSELETWLTLASESFTSMPQGKKFVPQLFSHIWTLIFFKSSALKFRSSFYNFCCWPSITPFLLQLSNESDSYCLKLKHISDDWDNHLPDKSPSCLRHFVTRKVCFRTEVTWGSSLEDYFGGQPEKIPKNFTKISASDLLQHIALPI